MPNPSVDSTIPLAWLLQEHEVARDDPDETRYKHFLSQHLNCEVDEHIGVDTWIPAKDWDRYADSTISLESLLQRCENRLWAGIDRGGLDDPSCLLLLGETLEGTLLAWTRQWLTRQGYEKRRHLLPYESFRDSEELHIVDAVDGDAEAIFGMLDQLRTRVLAVGVDPYRMTDVASRIEGELAIPVLGVSQGWKLSSSIHATERLIYSGKLRHTGGPMLRWNLQNTRRQERGRNVFLTKPTGSSEGALKIDAAIALVLAVVMRIKHPAPAVPSITVIL